MTSTPGVTLAHDTRLADRTKVWLARTDALAAALGGQLRRPSRYAGPEDLAADLHAITDLTDPARVWVAVAAVSGVFPDEPDVLEAAANAVFDGGRTVAELVAAHTDEHSVRWDVRLTGDTLVDVQHTVSVPFTTGIQRVVRETVARWVRDERCTLVAWTPGFRSLRALDAEEAARLSAPPGDYVHPDPDRRFTVLVPLDATYLLPELAAEPERTEKLRSLARFAAARTGVIGYDCVPITSAETVSTGVVGFARTLAAVRRFDAVATISHAAATEYLGWRDTLAAIGVEGPRIEAVPLPVEIADSSEADLAAARERLTVPGMPFVLVVGSHEPRKNHEAVLHAAELLWRAGLDFSLAFLGGGGWNSEGFYRRIATLQAAGRPVESAKGLDDRLLNAAYRLAHLTVFPSLNEGFGLPLAESLACGTPAITSNFGSMAEIAADGGALLVDPRDDHAIAAAMRSLLTDSVLHARLRRETRARRRRSWDDYAAECWQALTRPEQPN